MNHRLAPRVAAVLTKIAMALVAMVFFTLLAPLPQAQAATVFAKPVLGQTFKGGPGHSESVYAGRWDWNGKKGWCIDFVLHNPDGSGTISLAGDIVPGMTLDESKRAKHIANKYASTTSSFVAANAAFAIWTLRADTSFKTWYSWAKKNGVISASRHSAIQVILAESLTHGPYKVSVKVNPVYVGQTGTGYATVTGANGKPAKGLLSTITTSANAKILTVNGVTGSKGRTNASGVVKFTYKRLSVNTVSVKTSVVGPSSKTAQLTTPTAGRQRLLVGGFTESAAGSASFNKVLGRPTMVATCDTNCEGIATVRFTDVVNPSGSKMVKWTWRSGDIAVSLYVSSGATGSKSVKLLDGAMVTAEYCYVDGSGGACVTPTVKLSGAQEVVCPGWVVLTFTGDCPCEGGVNFKFTLTSPTLSPRYYEATVLKNGVVIQKIVLVNGIATTTGSVSLGSGDRLSVQFTAYTDSTKTKELRSGTLFDMSNNL